MQGAARSGFRCLGGFVESRRIRRYAGGRREIRVLRVLGYHRGLRYRVGGRRVVSFLMDELKKAERPQRIADRPVPPRPVVMPRPAAAGRRRPLRPALVALVGLAVLGGGYVAYRWAGLPATVPAVLVPPPSAERAQAALQTGELVKARGEYQRLLDAEPASLDALRGLAAVSQREGKPESAEQYYLRALKIDARDALAQNGLVGLVGLGARGEPKQAEARLKALLAARPELTFIHQALGKLFAGQGRWEEAFEAFFQVYRDEPDHPDILFNLAVSLDYLKRPDAAASYYRLALAAANRRPASFDRRQAEARLAALRK